MGESRHELLHWLNDLLQLNITKVEQIGTGAALCQIFDSIYYDVPLQKVKFNAKQEYEYLNNFKVLQTVFKVKKIDKPIPVERLVRCKMQDNLEFLQWVKKFWDANFPGEEYDAVGRRGGATIDNNPLISGAARTRQVAPARAPGVSPSLKSSTAAGAGAGARRAVGGARTPVGGTRPANAGMNQAVQQLTAQMEEMKVNVDGLEKERDFYFNKLREIEILIAARLEEKDVGEAEETSLKEMQAVLYTTEEGFEVPEEDALQDEEETF